MTAIRKIQLIGGGRIDREVVRRVPSATLIECDARDAEPRVHIGIEDVARVFMRKTDAIDRECATGAPTISLCLCIPY